MHRIGDYDTRCAEYLYIGMRHLYKAGMEIPEFLEQQLEARTKGLSKGHKVSLYLYNQINLWESIMPFSLMLFSG